MENNPMQESIDDIDLTKEKMDKKADDKDEPGYILYSAILNTSKEILSSPVFAESFKKIEKVLGTEETKSLLTVLSLAMTHSSYNTIQLYDMLLTENVNKMIGDINEELGTLRGAINGHQGAMEVFKKRLDKLEGKN